MYWLIFGLFNEAFNDYITYRELNDKMTENICEW